jgi:sulfate permease, SulP family
VRTIPPLLSRAFPFVRWFPMSTAAMRADLVAGLTVGLLLVPQSMAYAQLAWMPAYYGLYAAFLPVLVGALWGSSNQLATGPVAMVSILTSASLAQFAAPSSDQFIALAIALALLVGLMQCGLGVLRLGAVVSFVSHPVIVDFTNAAAIIIALSQLNKLLGVSIGRSEQFLLDVWGVLQQLDEVHLPTLAMAAGAIGLIVLLRRQAPKLPAILIAVVIATAASWLIGFERSTEIVIDQLADPDPRTLAHEHLQGENEIRRLHGEIGMRLAELRSLRSQIEHNRQHALTLDYQVQALRLEVRAQEIENRLRTRALRRFLVHESGALDNRPLYEAIRESASAAQHAPQWRIQRVAGENVLLVGGGEVVGRVPPGLPSVGRPQFGLETLGMLFSSALVITLVGFMEAISVAKAIATRTRQRISPNQELIGQGLANSLLVRKAAAKARDRAELFPLLSDNIVDPDQRRSFIRKSVAAFKDKK